jgi:serine/threonine protein kinase
MASQPPSSDTDAPSVEEFLKTVLRSGLIEADRLREILRGLPAAARDDSAAVADYFVRGGQLSRFQASRLLRGIAAGLMLGAFQLLAPIGRGGMGTVFMARDERSGQLVALKLLPPRLAREEERMRQRFVREMVVSQRVSHPHLCWTFETGQCRGVYYIAMEYIPGKNLSRLVREEGPLRLRRAARLLAEAAEGLEHAHNMGLVHRDMKPSNLMVTPHDHAKVLDLGLALIHGEKVEDAAVVGGQGYIVGTMDYISPEQTTDAAGVDRRSDIYSLGCTLYFALGGQPPFPGGTNKDKIRRHRREEPRPLEELNSAVPPAFAAVVRKMMAKDPNQRHPSAIAVAEDLGAWASGEAVQPLDQPEDAEYAQAVAALQTTVPSADFSLPNLSLPDLSPEEARAQAATLIDWKKWPVWLLPLLCAAGLWIGILITVLLIKAIVSP